MHANPSVTMSLSTFKEGAWYPEMARCLMCALQAVRFQHPLSLAVTPCVAVIVSNARCTKGPTNWSVCIIGKLSVIPSFAFSSWACSKVFLEGGSCIMCIHPSILHFPQKSCP